MKKKIYSMCIILILICMLLIAIPGIASAQDAQINVSPLMGVQMPGEMVIKDAFYNQEKKSMATAIGLSAVGFGAPFYYLSLSDYWYIGLSATVLDGIFFYGLINIGANSPDDYSIGAPIAMFFITRIAQGVAAYFLCDYYNDALKNDIYDVNFNNQFTLNFDYIIKYEEYRLSILLRL